MPFFDKKIPLFLTDRKNTIRQLIFTSVFALVFINLYSPFGLETWANLLQIQLFFYSSLVILGGLLIIAISRIIMHQIFKKKELNNLTYILWIAAEIASLASVYVLFQYLFTTKPDDVILAFEASLKKTSLVLLFPYTLSFLYFSWVEKSKRLEELSEASKIGRPKPPTMAAFRDEKNELRFSVKTTDLIYLEAADNYVIIHYLDGNKMANYMIRNSMKNIEQGMRNFGVVRCHRSYMVNFDRVKIVKREHDGLVLELDSPVKKLLPISRTYVEDVMVLFSLYSTQ